MAAPSPHDGPCKNCGSTEDVCGLGRYRGLCPPCRMERAAQAKGETGSGKPKLRPETGQRDMDGMRDEVKVRSDQRGKLKNACQELVGKAEKLEEALEQRNQARIHAQATLGEFKDALTLVGRVAQSLVNLRAEHIGDGS